MLKNLLTKRTNRIEGKPKDLSGQETLNRAKVIFRRATTGLRVEMKTFSREAENFNQEKKGFSREMKTFNREAGNFFREMISFNQKDVLRRRQEILSRGKETTARVSYRKCR